MWSKTKPGPFDRYTAAEPEEPIFVLLGRDPVASLLVSLWIGVHDVMGDNPPDAVLDAMQCSLAMEQWARTHGGNAEGALQAFLRVLRHTRFAEFASYGMPCIKCDGSGVWIRQGVAIHDQPCPVCSRTGMTTSTDNRAVTVTNRDGLH
jgi:hypothetical protein